MDVDRHVLLSLGSSWNTAIGCDFHLQEIFRTQGLDSHLLHFLHWLAYFLSLSHLGSPLFTHSYKPLLHKILHFLLHLYIPSL